MYIGRFAPSPTGPLHFGSLLAAVGSFLDAKANNGKWLVRMEDLDPPREQAGAADHILQTLELHGFEWDGSVEYQSQRHQLYADALETLKKRDLIYPCSCSRQLIAKRDSSGPYGTIYSGHCRNPKNRQTSTTYSLRLQTENSLLGFHDLIQQDYQQNLEQEIGDFNVQRRDGLFSYHLAVTVDDAAQGITHIVRGFDLLESTPRQIYIQQLMGFSTPEYAHLPIAVNREGDKLSKQTFAPALNSTDAPANIIQALEFLGQQPPAELKQANLNTVWQWALANWSLAQVPCEEKITLDGG